MQVEQGRLSESVRVARLVAFMVAEAEHGLGISNARLLPLDYRLNSILSGAMENPSAVDDATYSVVYQLSQQQQANVDHPELKKQPGGPLHQPKPEPQKQ